MAKAPSGILGRISGKVGDVVGASWKGIPYLRQYVIPANPNTPLQQAERSLFSDLVWLAKAALGPVLQVFWDPFLKGISGWARFIGRNRILYTTPSDFSPVHLTEGNLEGSTISSCSYAGTSVVVLFDDTIMGNGHSTDVPCLFVYDKVNKVGWFAATGDRASGSIDVTIGSGRTKANLCAWLFFADSSSAPTIVSYSVYSAVS